MFLSTEEWLGNLTGYFSLSHVSEPPEAGLLRVPNSRVSEEGQLITNTCPCRLLEQKEKHVVHCLISSKYTDKIMDE